MNGFNLVGLQASILILDQLKALDSAPMTMELLQVSGDAHAGGLIRSI
jgi:hypothetical protein